MASRFSTGRSSAKVSGSSALPTAVPIRPRPRSTTKRKSMPARALPSVPAAPSRGLPPMLKESTSTSSSEGKSGAVLSPGLKPARPITTSSDDSVKRPKTRLSPSKGRAASAKRASSPNIKLSLQRGITPAKGLAVPVIVESKSGSTDARSRGGSAYVSSSSGSPRRHHHRLVNSETRRKRPLKSYPSAVTELKEYLFECSEELSQMDDREKRLLSTLNQSQRELMSEIDSLKKMLDTKKNELIEVLNASYQDKVNLITSVRGGIAHTQSSLKRTLDQTRTVRSEGDKTKLCKEIDRVISEIPEFQDTSEMVSKIDLSMWFMHQCIDNMGKNYPSKEEAHTPVPRFHVDSRSKAMTPLAKPTSAPKRAAPSAIAPLDSSAIVDALFKSTPGSKERVRTRHSISVRPSGEMSAVSQMKRQSIAAKSGSDSEGGSGSGSDSSAGRRESKYATARVSYQDLKRAGLLDHSERMDEKKLAIARTSQVVTSSLFSDSEDETPKPSIKPVPMKGAWQEDSDDEDQVQGDVTEESDSDGW